MLPSARCHAAVRGLWPDRRVSGAVSRSFYGYYRTVHRDARGEAEIRCRNVQACLIGSPDSCFGVRADSVLRSRVWSRRPADVELLKRVSIEPPLVGAVVSGERARTVAPLWTLAEMPLAARTLWALWCSATGAVGVPGGRTGRPGHSPSRPGA